MLKLAVNNYEISIDEISGNILSIKNEENELKLSGSIWKIETADKKVLTTEDMTNFSYSLSKELNFCWSNEKVRVNVKIFEEDFKLKMNINTVSYDKALSRIVFPIYNAIEKISDEDYLVLPWQNGFLIKNPIDNLLNTDKEVPFWMGRGGKKYENDYPAQYSYQYFAYYAKNKKGYYMACEDGKAYTKTIAICYNETADAMDIVFTNYPEGMGEVKYYALPYVYTFCFFCGDWQNATKIYRQWAIKQKWCTPLRERNIPKAIQEIDFFRINHEHYALGTRSDEFIQTCKMIRDKLSCRPAMHWYGWNKAPKHGDWYPEMADYTNRNWYNELVEINKTLDKEGIKKIPYVNVHLWDKFLSSFEGENAAETLVLPESRVIEDEPWAAEGNLFAVCHANGKIKNKALSLFERLVTKDGFDGIYIDQVASFNATLCFNEKHGHPIGGGCWWNDEYHNMIGTLRKIMPKDKFLTTESCCECYHDLFDLFLILDTCSQTHGFHEVCGCENCESIPLFAMIYNDSAISYGSVCTFANNDEQFEFNFMRNILWGMVPTCEGMELEEISNDENKWNIIKKGVDFYKENRDVLLYGTFDEYMKFDCGEKTIYFGDFSKTCPGVICSIYNYGNNTYAFLYNYSPKLQTVEVKGKSVSVNSGEFTSVIL